MPSQLTKERITALDRQFHARLGAEIYARYPQYCGAALDMFARDGAMSISNCPMWSWDAWEIDGQYEKALVALGCANVVIGDTYKTVLTCATKYRMIWVDGPQGIFLDSDGGQHSEHFDLFAPAVNLLDSAGGLIVLYVNKSPYNRTTEGDYGLDSYSSYDFEQWMALRRGFYGRPQIQEFDALLEYHIRVCIARRRVKSLMIWPSIADLPGMPPSFRLVLEIV